MNPLKMPPREAKCLVALLGQIRFRDPGFLSVELVECTSVITGPKCDKGFICHD